MSLNCRPGDLARVVGLPPSCRLGNDRFVKLKNEPAFIGHGGDPCWKLEEAFTFAMAADAQSVWTGEVFVEGQLVYVYELEDKYLRPIRGGETPEESIEAMKRLHDTSAPAKKKEPVVRPFEWEAL